MSKELLIGYTLILHFIADFCLQSREMGKNKSTNFSVLLDHLGILVLVSMSALAPIVGLHTSIWFALENALIHGMIDWNIWRVYKWSVYKRINSKRDSHLLNTSMPVNPGEVWRYWDDHWFYVTIGFDQLLHALTLVLLSILLFN